MQKENILCLISNEYIRMIYSSLLRQIFHASALKIRGVVIALGGIAHDKKARSGRTAAIRGAHEQMGHQFHQNKHKRVNM